MANENREEETMERSEKGTKKALRFNCFQDVMLLREVVGQNPFSGNGQKPWDIIATSLQIYIPSITGRCCRERTMRLLKMFREHDRVNLRKSGTEELYDEKQQLLQDISALEEERQCIQEEQTRLMQQETDESEPVEHIEAAVMMSMSSFSTSNSPVDDVPPQPTSKRKCNSDCVHTYLKKKHAAELEMRHAELQFQKEKLEVEKQRIALEERKLELESDRWKMEREERCQDRQTMLDLIKLAFQKQTGT